MKYVWGNLVLLKLNGLYLFLNIKGNVCAGPGVTRLQCIRKTNELIQAFHEEIIFFALMTARKAKDIGTVTFNHTITPSNNH